MGQVSSKSELRFKRYQGLSQTHRHTDTRTRSGLCYDLGCCSWLFAIKPTRHTVSVRSGCGAGYGSGNVFIVFIIIVFVLLIFGGVELHLNGGSRWRRRRNGRRRFGPRGGAARVGGAACVGRRARRRRIDAVGERQRQKVNGNRRRQIIRLEKKTYVSVNKSDPRTVKRLLLICYSSFSIVFYSIAFGIWFAS